LQRFIEKLTKVESNIDLLEEKLSKESDLGKLRHEQILSSLREIKEEIRELKSSINKGNFGGL